MKYQVVVLAGGSSSRFYPFDNLHKSFFTLVGKTILERTVESIKKTDPLEIIIVLSSKWFKEEKEMCEKMFTFDGIKYVSQNASRGQADAILSAEECVNENFFVVNAQQFMFSNLADRFVKAFETGTYEAVLGAIKTDTPEKYGILDLEGSKVKGIVEKPKTGTEPSDKRLVGMYLFSLEIFKYLRQTDISEYSLEIVLDKMAKENKVAAINIEEKLPSLKYPWDVFMLKDQILAENKSEIDPNSVVEKTAVIKGDAVFIGRGAHVCDFAIIEGPAYIGENAIVGAYSQIRGGTVLEDGAQVERYADVKNSYIGKNTHIHSGFVGDSVIGANVRIGASFITANRRLDRKNIKSSVQKEKVDTGLTKFGAVIGDNIHIGVNVSVMPGVVIGSNTVIGPQTLITKNISANTLYYSEFKSYSKKNKNV